MSRNAEPTRLLTLTQSTKDWQREDGAGVDGRRCWETTAPAFSELIRLIRKLVGECEYLKVLELTDQGLPHFHCMLRCDFVPQAVLLKEWRRLTGTAGVNIKRIDKSFATFRYLVKYLTKLHKIEWTDRHVSYSRNFFRPEDKEEVAYAKLEQVEHFEQHPWVWLRERSEWSRVRVLGEGKWELPGPVPDREFSFDPAEIGLPSSRPIAPPPAPLTQRLVPGMLDVDVPADDTVPTKRRRKKRATDASTVPFKFGTS
jgi:hypothetical protein